MTERDMKDLDAGPGTPLPWAVQLAREGPGAPYWLIGHAAGHGAFLYVAVVALEREADARYLAAAANAAPALRAEVTRLRAALLRVENVLALQGNAAEVLATIREAMGQ